MGKGDYESSSLGEDAKEAKTWESMNKEEETLKYSNQAFNDPYFEIYQCFLFGEHMNDEQKHFTSSVRTHFSK